MNFNPYALLIEMAKNDPNAKAIIEQIEKGANPEQLFRSLCQTKGVDADEFIKDIQKKYGNFR